MPFSHRPALDAYTVQTLPTLQERYALRRCMADTALGKLYWAQDLKQTQNNGEQTNVLVFTLLPALAQNPVFEQAFGHVLHGYQKPAPGMPHVVDDGKTADGLRWIIIRNSGGMLLSERLAELDDRGMPVPEALELLDSINNAIANQRPDGVFGFLEPDAVLLGDKLPCLLTAPIAAALRATYNSTPNERSRQTLHSGYISPEVLLGDTPTTADDTFFIASLAYHLLQGEAPFGKQSALEATVRNLSPTSIRKLRPEAWAVLKQGLDLKRATRHKNPSTLLRALQRKQQKKLLLPLAALVAAGAVAMTTYHLLSSRDTQPIDAPETVITPALDQASVQAQADKLAAETAANARVEAERAEAERLAAAAASAQATLATENDLSTLQDNAAAAIRQGNLFSTDPEQPAAVDYLRKAIAMNADDTKTQKLLAQLINDQHTEAEALLSANKLDEASTLLSTADRLITEFTFADGLKRQVSLETEVEQAKRKQALAQATTTSSTVTATNATTPPSVATDTNTTTNTTAVDDDARQYLERAQRAISFGNLNTGDDRGESAVAYLSTLLEKTPAQPDALKLLAKVATLQQENASAAMRKRDTEKARTALDDSQTLIGKYKLDSLVEEQIALEKRYRETLAMGVFVPGKEEPAPITASKPEPAKPTEKPAPAPVAAPQETENPEAAEAARVEVAVPADIPVRNTAPPVPTELPAIQLDAPPPAPQPAPIPAPPAADKVIFEVPVTDADNVDVANPNGNTFTPDVPNLMELPLDSITNSPPPNNQ
jgi:tetratricopeptide (TPR) repeat protein